MYFDFLLPHFAHLDNNTVLPLLVFETLGFMFSVSILHFKQSKLSEALINSEINHEDFMTIINEETKYWELEESIRMMNSQRSNTKKNNLKKVKK